MNETEIKLSLMKAVDKVVELVQFDGEGGVTEPTEYAIQELKRRISALHLNSNMYNDN